jgi:lysophospholipase L1-like esterase
MRFHRCVLLAAIVAAAPCPAWAAAEEPKEASALADAVECHPRSGLPNFFAKLAAGAEVHVAFLGGSITAQQGWRPKTLKFFQDLYPKAKVTEINAAIGGTGSDLGVFRLRHDVLRLKPDLMFVEFAVNDGGASTEDIYRSMEGIVRQTWKADPACDICFVYTVTTALLPPLQEGKFPRAATAMERVADHYGIPSVHMAMEVARLAKEGTLIMAARKPKSDEEREALKDKVIFAEDGVHPYPETGHQIYLEAIQRAMPGIKAAGGNAAPHTLGDPLIADNWERAKLLPLSAAKLSAEWQKLDPASDKMARTWTARMPEFWKAGTAGAAITFKFKGVAAAIYDLLGPDCGQVRVTVDDGPPRTVPRFDRYSNYHRLAMLGVARGLPDAVHTVKIELLADPPDKARILQEGRLAAEDPKGPKYAGINWYAGGVLIVGDLAE